MPGFSKGLPLLRPWPFLLGLLLIGVSFPGGGRAQIISPGKLSTPHAELEGMSNCTQCHQLRVPGADRDRCLQCHQALGARIDENQGYHGRLEEEDCGVCHKEHLGEDFNLIRMDPDTFPHALTGYELEGAHTEVECRTCHTSANVSDPLVLEEMSNPDALERSYLGLDTRCRSCHTGDDPHAGQFQERECSTCNTTEKWEEPEIFDHDQSPFPLDGLHERVECSGCHVVDHSLGGDGVIRYDSVAASDCVSCHADPHGGQMTGRCSACHSTSGWSRINQVNLEAGFDHGTTGFPLVGAHDGADCAVCHTPASHTRTGIVLQFQRNTLGRSYPRPEHENCTSCHLDAHDGTFDNRSCDACHTSGSWTPPDFGRAQHQMELRFQLSGAHAVTPCSDCHERGEGDSREFVFRFADPGKCAVCHQADDPHEGDFEIESCDLCHQSTVFQLERFNHDLLEDAGWGGDCQSCHDTDQPHEDQFLNRDCGECHSTEDFTISRFDHGKTRFPLEGAHQNASCESCHLAETGPSGSLMVRYRPIETDCSSCHGGAA